LIAVEKLKKPDRLHSVFQLSRGCYIASLKRKQQPSRTKETANVAGIAGGNTSYNFISPLAPALLASTMTSNGR
jgi:hypothetical protein